MSVKVVNINCQSIPKTMTSTQSDEPCYHIYMQKVTYASIYPQRQHGQQYSVRLTSEIIFCRVFLDTGALSG